MLNTDNVHHQALEHLTVGIDLGTSQSAIATSNGRLINVASIVGFAKDLVAYKLLKKQILYGDECYRKRLSLDLYYPLEKGVIDIPEDRPNSERQKEAIDGFLRYLISLIDKKENQKLFVIIGAPARATVEEKQVIRKLLEGLVDSVVVVSEPFLVAYGMGMYGFSVIVDIGAGTLDICRMHGSIPEPGDQRTLYKAGNFIDKTLYDLVKTRIPNARISPLLMRRIKEQFAFIGKKANKTVVEFQVGGKMVPYDITNELRDACLTIVPDMIKVLRELILDFDPEYQQELRENIIIAGCGSRIQGLAGVIEQELASLGKIKIRLVEDPIYAGAVGGLKLAQDMPLEEWNRM